MKIKKTFVVSVEDDELLSRVKKSFEEIGVNKSISEIMGDALNCFVNNGAMKSVIQTMIIESEGIPNGPVAGINYEDLNGSPTISSLLLDKILMVVDCIRCVPKSRRVNTTHTAYRLKHLVENHIGEYIPVAVFSIAAGMLGFKNSDNIPIGSAASFFNMPNDLVIRTNKGYKFNMKYMTHGSKTNNESTV